MRLPLDRQSEVPLYQQIEAFFRLAILAGQLPPKTRLPATRQLAHDLGLNRLTVDNAYAELEADGLIDTRPGSGAYVLPVTAPPLLSAKESAGPWPLWQQALCPSAAPPPVSKPGTRSVIAFESGAGDPDLFPANEIRRTLQAVLRRDGLAAWDYGDQRGYAPLRENIAEVMASQGLAIRPDNVLITAGSQQALALVTQVLLKPGETVVVESPTYAGALDLFRMHGLKLIGAPVDEHGLDMDKLEPLLQQHHPHLLYTIPNFQNPTGTCLSGARRRQLLALAERYNVPILEDDFVGDLRYDGHAQPTLKALDSGGRVIYVSTFSKMLMPGLRVGFLVAEGPVYDCLVDAKRVTDLVTSNLNQRALEAYMTVGRYQAHLRRSCRLYRQRRDAMLGAIERHLPAGVQVVPPQGGLFVWLRLPGGASATRLLPAAARAGVTFAPGPSFFPEAAGDNYLRLNFAVQPPEAIEEGLRRLGKVLGSYSSSP